VERERRARQSLGLAGEWPTRDCLLAKFAVASNGCLRVARRLESWPNWTSCGQSLGWAACGRARLASWACIWARSWAKLRIKCSRPARDCLRAQTLCAQSVHLAARGHLRPSSKLQAGHSLGQLSGSARVIKRDTWTAAALSRAPSSSRTRPGRRLAPVSLLVSSRPADGERRYRSARASWRAGGRQGVQEAAKTPARSLRGRQVNTETPEKRAHKHPWEHRAAGNKRQTRSGKQEEEEEEEEHTHTIIHLC